MNSLEEWIKSFKKIDNEIYSHIELYFIGEGVGESTIIHIPGKWVGVVDAFGTVNGSVTKAILDLLNINTINFVFLSHYHYDHFSGLGYILNNVAIEKYAQPSFAKSDDLYKLLVALDCPQNTSLWKNTPAGNLVYYLHNNLQKLGQNYYEGNNSTHYLSHDIKSDDNASKTKLNIQGLAPFPHILQNFIKRLPKRLKENPLRSNNKDDADINLTSLVLKITYGKNVIILTGDSENKALNCINLESIFNEPGLNSLVLKVPHHGSKTSIADLFFKQELTSLFNKKIAVVTPNRPHKLPEDDVLEHYLRAGYDLYQTETTFKETTGDGILETLKSPAGKCPSSIVRVILSHNGKTSVDFFGKANQII